MDKVVGLREAADMTGVSYGCLYAAARSGELKSACRIGKRWVVNATREWPMLFGQQEDADASGLRGENESLRAENEELRSKLRKLRRAIEED